MQNSNNRVRINTIFIYTKHVLWYVLIMSIYNSMSSKDPISFCYDQFEHFSSLLVLTCHKDGVSTWLSFLFLKLQKMTSTPLHVTDYSFVFPLVMIFDHHEVVLSTFFSQNMIKLATMRTHSKRLIWPDSSRCQCMPSKKNTIKLPIAFIVEIMIQCDG